MQEIVILFGVVLVVSLNACVLILGLKNKRQLTHVEMGMAAALKAIYERVDELVDLPETLQGIGGVQLMPQKSFGEIAIEHIMGTLFGEKRLNAEHESEEAWPQGVEPEKLPEEPPSQ